MLRVKRIDSLTRLQHVAVVRERSSSAVCHLRVAEHVGLFCEVQARGDDHARVLVHAQPHEFAEGDGIPRMGQA